VPVRSHFYSHGRASPRRFFRPVAPNRSAGFMVGWVRFIERSMCDTAYMRSQRVPLRSRNVGFDRFPIYDDSRACSLDNLQVAVCLRPGTRSHSSNDVQLMA